MENRIPPPLVALIIAVLMGAVAGMFGIVTLILPWQRMGAGLVVLAGLLCMLAGVWSFRKARTTINPLKPETASALVRGGIFARSRNPMYLGMALVLTGWALFLGNLLALAGVWAFVAWINRWQIAPEERALARLFGAEFAEYCKQVPRWV
jgi:protein-S-isoprenylcysteine O-methyltransferase Ste14